MAAVGPKQGGINVEIGGQQVGFLKLRSSTYTPRTVLLLPAFAQPRSGVVTLTTTSGRTVQVDGLAVITD